MQVNELKSAAQSCLNTCHRIRSFYPDRQVELSRILRGSSIEPEAMLAAIERLANGDASELPADCKRIIRQANNFGASVR